jgi:hypothetical protein
MALDTALEDLLKLVPGPEADAAREFFEKSPAVAKQVKEGTLRQADYSRNMNALKTEKEQFDGTRKEHVDWFERTKPRHEALLTEHETLKTKLAAVQAELATRPTGEGEMNPAELNAAVDARLEALGDRYVPKAEMEKIAKQEAQKLAEAAVDGKTTKFLTETWPAATEIMNRVIETQFMAMQEFGKPLTVEERAEVAKVMTERKIPDPVEAYNQWAQPKRDAKKVQDEIKKGVDAGLEEARKAGAFPGVSGVPELGPVQQARAGKVPTLPDNYQVGDGSAAMAAAAELRSEGKG